VESQRKENSNAQGVIANTTVLLKQISLFLSKLTISSKVKSLRVKIISRFFAKIIQKLMLKGTVVPTDP
jgi:hypothetical protein